MLELCWGLGFGFGIIAGVVWALILIRRPAIDIPSIATGGRRFESFPGLIAVNYKNFLLRHGQEGWANF